MGYCLAEDVCADRDIPPRARSAMDGYAVRAADAAKVPYTLRLVGEVAAGSPARPRVLPGTCVAIMTGANVPPGADAVAVIEHARLDEDKSLVTFREPVKKGANILRPGEDAKKGVRLLAKHTPLGPLQIGVCAAVGETRPRAYRLPRVAVFGTGTELVEAEAKVRPHEVRNSNGPALKAALAIWGFNDVTVARAADDVKGLTSRLRGLVAKRDVVLLTGGVSVGKYDFVPEAVERLGATVRFHGVAMKPGKPILYATLPGNRHVFGLPGPPLSAMTGLNEFALPALRRMSGFAAGALRPSLHVRLASPLTSKGGRVRFVLARLAWRGEGVAAVPVRSKSSADLVAGGKADGAIVVPREAKELAAGTLVEFRPWRPLP